MSLGESIESRMEFLDSGSNQSFQFRTGPHAEDNLQGGQFVRWQVMCLVQLGVQLHGSAGTSLGRTSIDDISRDFSDHIEHVFHGFVVARP